MGYYDNNILKFTNYLNNEKTSIKEILKSLEILEYHLKNRTYNLFTYINPLLNIFTKEEYDSLLKYNYQNIISKKRIEYTNKLAMIDSLLNKLDKKETLDEYIKTNEFISLLRESNLSTEEQARVVYQINCINVPIIERVIAKKESLRTNISSAREELITLLKTAVDTYNSIQSKLNTDYQKNDRLATTIKPILESLLEEIDFAKYILSNNIELSKMKDITDVDSILTESIDNINLMLNTLFELTNNLSSKEEPHEEEPQMENKIIYLTDENNLPFLNCESKDAIELINELKKGLISSNGTRYVKGIDSIKDTVYVKTKQKETAPSVSFIKINNFIIVISIEKLEDIYSETIKILKKYSTKISSIKEQINSLPLPILHESDLVEESIISKSGKRGK